MDEINKSGENQLPSVLQNPFFKDKITCINVYYQPKLFNQNEWEASGSIKFQNGATSGKQDFKAKTFDDCVMQMKAFIEQLTNKPKGDAKC